MLAQGIVNTARIPTPMQGVCYQPAPTDYQTNNGPTDKYFDTDFFNSDFTGLWSTQGGGRGDLANMADLAVNFLHLYDWNPPPDRDHGSFLQECADLGIFVAVPFNNSFCANVNNGSWGEQAIFNAMQEIYQLGNGSEPFSNVAMWTIANEFNNNGPSAQQVAWVAQVILYCESVLGNSVVLPISSPTAFSPTLSPPPSSPAPTSTSPGIAPTQQLQIAFANTESFTAKINGEKVTIPALPETFFLFRYVVSTNPENPGSVPPANPGTDTVASFLMQSSNAFPWSPIWFGELGIGIADSCNGYPSTCVASPTQQAAFTTNQLQNTTSPMYLLGSCIFEYTPDYQNSIDSVQYTYSLLNDNGGTTTSIDFTIPENAPFGGGETYPVQCLLTNNPVYAAVKQFWNPNGSPSPPQYCPSSPSSGS